MKILIAPDSFKDSLSSTAVARALCEGLKRVLPAHDYQLLPLADGGEGTLAALASAGKSTVYDTIVLDALGRSRRARYAVLDQGHTGVVEIAEACGLAQLEPSQRRAEATTSYGVGELVRAVLLHNPQRLLIAIGGSATVDGGAGMLQALGVRFYDRHGELMTAPLCGQDLDRIVSIEPNGMLKELSNAKVEVACDVDNPLLGASGAAEVFAPQKGADETTVAQLERNLAHFYALVEQTLEIAVVSRPGAGAAGGIGAALMAFAKAELVPGIERVLEVSGMRKHLGDADLLITGEGRLDQQTLYGKAPLGAARLAQEMNIPVIAVGGALAAQAGELFLTHFDAVEAAVRAPATTNEALTHAYDNLVDTGVRIGMWLKLAERLSQ